VSDQNNKNDNNFFKDNPLIAFAIFSVVVIVIFKLFIGNNQSIWPWSKARMVRPIWPGCGKSGSARARRASNQAVAMPAA
jgi:hypothetical protein